MHRDCTDEENRLEWRASAEKFPTLVSELADGKNERSTAAQFRCAAFSSKHLYTYHRSCKEHRAMAEPDDVQLDLRTVFVKGVSFDWDNKDFEEALSNIGPLRKCFLLKGAGKNHKVRVCYIIQGGNWLYFEVFCCTMHSRHLI